MIIHCSLMFGLINSPNKGSFIAGFANNSIPMNFLGQKNPMKGAKPTGPSHNAV